MELPDLKLNTEVRDLGLQISSDDFSCRITRPDDPRFWIRLETGTDDVSITDFNRASLTQPEMSIALLAILKRQGLARAPRLRFLNVTMPADSIDAEYRAVLGHFAKRTGRVLQKLERSVRLGKIDVIAEFSA